MQAPCPDRGNHHYHHHHMDVHCQQWSCTNHYWWIWWQTAEQMPLLTNPTPTRRHWSSGRWNKLFQVTWSVHVVEMMREYPMMALPCTVVVICPCRKAKIVLVAIGLSKRRCVNREAQCCKPGICQGYYTKEKLSPDRSIFKAESGLSSHRQMGDQNQWREPGNLTDVSGDP